LTTRAFTLITVVSVLACLAWPAKKKKETKEEETQVLQLPKELPGAVAGNTRKLLFYVTPLSARGLLSQQVKDALRSIERQAGGNTILKIRAFVAGTGDLRRVRDLVSETFTEKRQPLPVLSLIQAGALPLEGAQVVMEAIAEGKKDSYPGGLVFVSAQPAASPNPLDPVAPLTARSVEALGRAFREARVEPADVLRVTCYLSSLDDFGRIRGSATAQYPHAAWNFLQNQRAPMQGLAACEAVAGRRGASGEPLQLLNPDGMPRVEHESQVAVVGAPQIILTGTQVSFGYEVADARLAFERLEKALMPWGVSSAAIAFAHFYPLSPKLSAQVRTVRGSYFGEHAPASSIVEMEGLSSLDSGFAVDVVAVK
jgi:enamine deaminase RidA (YjgF/YER057c/UK114 family)